MEFHHPEPPIHSNVKKPWWHISLTQAIIASMFIGIIIGYISFCYSHNIPFFADLGMSKEQLKALEAQNWNWGKDLIWIRTIFLNLIKSLIAPLVFSTIVVGIAGSGNTKMVGKMGAKAMLYFTFATSIALIIGLTVVNLLQPGIGVDLTGASASDMVAKVGENHPRTFVETLTHMFTPNILASMVNADVLQIVIYAVLFALGILAVGDKGKPVVTFCESLAQIMFGFTELIMKFAPFGVGAAMAVTIAEKGLNVLGNLGLLILSLYIALLFFFLLVLVPVMMVCKIPVFKFIKSIREPATLAFVTTSSESALPKAMQIMEKFGVPKPIVGFVMPTGYSFNLDGSTLYLAMASIFIAQAAGSPIGNPWNWAAQLPLMLTLMLTSKGVAAVPRASLVVLLATCASFNLPVAGVAIIFAVDEVMDMARTALNLVGNCLATAVVARWEGVFDDEKMNAYTP